MADDRARVLRREITARERGRGKKYPFTLRLRAGAWIETQIAEGISLREAGRRIGIDDGTAQRWLRTAQVVASRRPSTALKPVESIGEETAASAAERVVTVVSPAGFRVDGLTLAEAAELMRALG